MPSPFDRQATHRRLARIVVSQMEEPDWPIVARCFYGKRVGMNVRRLDSYDRCRRPIGQSTHSIFHLRAEVIDPCPASRRCLLRSSPTHLGRRRVCMPLTRQGLLTSSPRRAHRHVHRRVRSGWSAARVAEVWRRLQAPKIGDDPGGKETKTTTSRADENMGRV